MSDGSSARPTPSAEGNLAARPLSHLLVYARTKRLSGKLVLQTADGRGGAIALWRGQIAAARTTPPMAYFGAVAAEMRFVDAPTAEATQREAAQQRRLHGELLIERGKLSGAQRDAVLLEQTCRKVHQLFKLPAETIFAFYEERPRDVEPPVTVDPIAPVWRGIRDGSASDNLRETLAPFLGGVFRVVNEAPFARAGFSPDEKAVAEALANKPMSIAQLVRTFPSVRPEGIDRLIYLLLLTKSAEPASAAAAGATAAKSSIRQTAGSMDADAIAEALKGSLRPVKTPSSPPPVVMTRNSVAPAYPSGPMAVPKVQSSIPARRISGSVGQVSPPQNTRVPTSSATNTAAATTSARPAAEIKPAVGPADLGAEAITLRAQTVEDEDPFVTLGLPNDAPPDAVRAAYFRLVKLWHPDRLSADLAPVRVDVGKIFTQMTSAHQLLSDPQARSAFVTARAERAALLKRPRKDVIRLIDTALSKKDWSFAGDEARKLVEGDREDAEALALLAWIGSLAAEGPEAAVRSALPILDKAVARDAQCARAHFYRGMINKRLGNITNAYKDFSRTLQLDPKHVDATREVRIYEMRMKKKS
jgi:hypothetical protein